MARTMDAPVPVTVQRGPEGLVPAAFRWRGDYIRVDEVVDTWLYLPPWWDSGQAAAQETWYRVRSTGGGLYELATADRRQWRLCKVRD